MKNKGRTFQERLDDWGYIDPPTEAERLDKISQIHAMWDVQDEARDEIAGLLEEELDLFGEKKWLKWCEEEFGWNRRSAYAWLKKKGV